MGARWATVGRTLGLVLLALILPRADGSELDDARTLAAEAKHGEAVALFERVIKANPKNAEAHAGKAASLLAMNRIEPAREAIEAALALKEDEPGYQMILGRILVANNQIDPARQRYERAAKTSPAKAGAIYADFAAALAGRNDPKLASVIDAALRAAARATPPHLESLFNLGQSYISAGHEEGKVFLQRYLEESAKLPEKQRDSRKMQLARQMIRAMEILKSAR